MPMVEIHLTFQFLVRFHQLHLEDQSRCSVIFQDGKLRVTHGKGQYHHALRMPP